jgi:hypothetical protein
MKQLVSKKKRLLLQNAGFFPFWENFVIYLWKITKSTELGAWQSFASLPYYLSKEVKHH